MKSLVDMLNLAIIKMQIAKNNFLSDERGDTNFISIAIILVVVIALAVVFITFGDDITEKLEEATSKLLDAL